MSTEPASRSSRGTAPWATGAGERGPRIVGGLLQDVRRLLAVARWSGPTDAPGLPAPPNRARTTGGTGRRLPLAPGVRLDGPNPARLPDGPVILVANHPTAAAAGYVLARLGRGRRGRTVLVTTPGERLGLPARLTARRTMRISFDAPGRAGVRLCERLGEGWSALIFPEGPPAAGATRRPFHSFAADLAEQTGIPVVPVGIRGAHAVGVKPGPARVSVRFGDPVHAGADARDHDAAVNGLIAEDYATWWAVQRSEPGRLPGTRPPETAHSWRQVWAQTAAAHQGGVSAARRIWHLER